MERYHPDNLHQLCDLLADRHESFRQIIKEYGYPPLWIRPNTYETLVLTILEQQVSLASAYAAYSRLKALIGEVTPEKLIVLTDEELRNCSFTRQKIRYTRGLAEAILDGTINLPTMAEMQDAEVRIGLKKLKGIGDWTVDIYLIHALQHTDVFPIGDLALINAIKMIGGLDSITKEEAVAMAEPWRPYRSIATMLFWHYYIRKKGIKLGV
jgi:DNA-3-methyladenine glycosylase II